MEVLLENISGYGIAKEHQPAANGKICNRLPMTHLKNAHVSEAAFDTREPQPTPLKGES